MAEGLVIRNPSFVGGVKAGEVGGGGGGGRPAGAEMPII